MKIIHGVGLIFSTFYFAYFIKSVLISGISLADETSTLDNTSFVDFGVTLTSNQGNITKNISIKNNEEYLTLNEGLDFAYQSADQTAPSEESLVKDTELSVDELRAQMASL